MFIHLNTHSVYSAMRGLLSLPDLMNLAKSHAMDTLALTDVNGMWGFIRFVQHCKDARILPISGTVLKSVGDRVEASDVVAETFMPGNITPMNVANMLSMPPADVPECMLLAEGDTVEDGTILAQTKGIFGMFKSTCASRAAGTVETISNVTGQVIIRGKPLPVQVTAYIAGEVVEVIADGGRISASRGISPGPEDLGVTVFARGGLSLIHI